MEIVIAVQLYLRDCVRLVVIGAWVMECLVNL